MCWQSQWNPTRQPILATRACTVCFFRLIIIFFRRVLWKLMVVCDIIVSSEAFILRWQCRIRIHVVGVRRRPRHSIFIEDKYVHRTHLQSPFSTHTQPSAKCVWGRSRIRHTHTIRPLSHSHSYASCESLLSLSTKPHLKRFLFNFFFPFFIRNIQDTGILAVVGTQPSQKAPPKKKRKEITI